MKRFPSRRLALVLMLIGMLIPISAVATAAEKDEPLWLAISKITRPWTRWWWHGSAVNERDLSRLMKLYSEAGLGGVEITPIYGVKGQEEKALPYLSPQWLAAFRHVCAEAERLEMGVDTPPGTGWRMGGPSVVPTDADSRVVIETAKTEGGRQYENDFKGKNLQALMAFPEEGAPANLFNMIGEDGQIIWPVPPGNWIIYALSQKGSGAKVKRPAPGGAGLSINPFSRRALLAYLENFAPLLQGPSAPAFRAMFHDSFEYSGDWTDGVLSEFQKRRGYDLADHLPAFTGVGEPDEVSRVKSDYRQTMGELLLENFTIPWSDWCHSHGLLTRNQAHGSPGNLLDLYGAVDIPETEIFRHDDNPLVLKFASSAAHVTGHPLTSAESCTWLEEHFTVTLDNARHALDGLFLAGVNHVFYHGAAYSPEEAKWPGWLFYASTQFNDRNPIWRDFPLLNAYVARCQAVLQAGRPDNDVLVYWPIFDVWANPRGLNMNFAIHNNEWITRNSAGTEGAVLSSKGYAFDFISDRQILGLQTEDGDLVAPGGEYQTIAIPTCHFMPAETAEALMTLAHQGATIIMQAPLPEDVPGLGDLASRRERFHKAMGWLLEKAPRDHVPSSTTLTVYSHGAGRVVVASSLEEGLRAANVRRETMCDCEGLQWIRRRMNDGYYYFVANRGADDMDQWVPLSPASAVVVMDPMTGATGKGSIRIGSKNTTEVYLQIPVGGVLLLRLMEGDVPSSCPDWVYYRDGASDGSIALKGPWKLEFLEGGPVKPDTRMVEAPVCWTEIGDPDMDRFAGTARYSVSFDRPEGQGPWALELGSVHESARVFVNDKEVASLISPPWRAPLVEFKEGRNTLRIEVTNTAANRIRDMDRRGEEWKIFEDINIVDVDYKKFDASQWPVRESGLAGPVVLKPRRIMTSLQK